MYKHILVALDGSKLSDKAVKTAIELAKDSGASVTGLYAASEYKTPYYPEGVFYDWPTAADYKKSILQSAEKWIVKVNRLAADAKVNASVVVVLDDHPHEAIIAQARKVKADLIVMASHGKRAVSALLLGSETQKVLALTKIPVLVVR
jgi:nucleotide-binding universal stress UspA family protein